MSIPCPTRAHGPPTVEPRKTYVLCVVQTYVLYVCFWVSRIECLWCMLLYERRPNNHLIYTAHIIPGSSTYITTFACLAPSFSCPIPFPAWNHCPPSMEHKNTDLRFFISHVCVAFTFASRKQINSHRISCRSHISKRISRKRRSLVESVP